MPNFRPIWTLATLGQVLALAAVWLAHRATDPSELKNHLIVGLAALLATLLAGLWALIYGLGVSQLVRRSAAGACGHVVSAARGVAWGAGATVLLAALTLVSAGLYLGHVAEAKWHHIIAWLGWAGQILLLAAGWVRFRRLESELLALERTAPGRTLAER
jgi:hypothetical protein